MRTVFIISALMIGLSIFGFSLALAQVPQNTNSIVRAHDAADGFVIAWNAWAKDHQDMIVDKDDKAKFHKMATAFDTMRKRFAEIGYK